ncbi:MAG TPA: NUDIX domain-containing protein [Actinomycetota bacterium]|nr:NUDIX domain-containing protein [Actinomycetota bacterium]
MRPDGPSEPRPAATMIAARRGANGVEVLVLKRGSEHRFLPGYLAFPGGAVEPQDGGLASRWFGSPAESDRACAVRELIEEAGLALTAAGLVSVAGDDRGLSAVHASPPPADALREISHWVAPEQVPVRFDARFFAVDAPPGLEPHPDGAEAERAWWARPADVLRDFAEGRCDLYWPTLKTMEALATCHTVEDVLALHVPQVEPD